MSRPPMQNELDFSRASYPDGLPGHHGRDTERAAAEFVAETGLEGKLRLVHDLVDGNGAVGATYPEVVEQLGSDSFQRRLSDLARLGFVVDSGLRRPSPRGRPCTVWVTRRWL